jgi:hypothetical protein
MRVPMAFVLNVSWGPCNCVARRQHFRGRYAGRSLDPCADCAGNRPGVDQYQALAGIASWRTFNVLFFF